MSAEVAVSLREAMAGESPMAEVREADFLMEAALVVECR